MIYLTHEETIALIARIQQGDQQALAELYAVYERLVFVTAIHFLYWTFAIFE